MPDFSFTEEGHTYLLDGQRLPSITEIMRAVRVHRADGNIGAWFSYEFLSAAKSADVLARGSWLADLCALRVSRGAPFAPIFLERLKSEAPDWFGFFPAFERWIQRAYATGFAPLLIEQPLYSLRYRFAGRPDLVCLLAARPSVIELKTGSALDETRVQTAAQAILLEEAADYPYRREPHRRYALELPGDGGEARLIEHKNHARDRSHFLSALTLYQAFNETNGGGK